LRPFFADFLCHSGDRLLLELLGDWALFFLSCMSRRDRPQIAADAQADHKIHMN
jgi:hypothetical protein